MLTSSCTKRSMFEEPTKKGGLHGAGDVMTFVSSTNSEEFSISNNLRRSLLDRTGKSTHLEVRAAFLAIQYFLPQLQDVPIILKSDNTTALATLRHRRSHNFSAEPDCLLFVRTIRSCRSSLLSCEYISTHENPADLSRSKPLRAPALTACGSEQ